MQRRDPDRLKGKHLCGPSIPPEQRGQWLFSERNDLQKSQIVNFSYIRKIQIINLSYIGKIEVVNPGYTRKIRTVKLSYIRKYTGGLAVYLVLVHHLHQVTLAACAACSQLLYVWDF